MALAPAADHDEPLRTRAPQDGFEIHIDVLPWIETAPGIANRYMMFDLRKNSYVTAIRIDPGCAMPSHYRTEPAIGRIIQGHCAYREKGWAAIVGSTVYEAAGEIHTLRNPAQAPTIAVFHVTGPFVVVDDDGRQIAYRDAFTIREAVLRHCRGFGIDTAFIDRITR